MKMVNGGGGVVWVEARRGEARHGSPHRARDRFRIVPIPRPARYNTGIFRIR